MVVFVFFFCIGVFFVFGYSLVGLCVCVFCVVGFCVVLGCLLYLGMVWLFWFVFLFVA